MTTVIVKLESIGTGVSEIKSDMRNIKEDIVDLRERMIIVEQSVKSAHHRIDSIEVAKPREQIRSLFFATPKCNKMQRKSVTP